MSDESSPKSYVRLSDKVLEALNFALDQKDVAIAELLTRCMEMAMTRAAGGPQFVERRDLSDAVEAAMTRFDKLKKEARGE